MISFISLNIIADILITFKEISLAVTPVCCRINFIPWESGPVALIYRFRIARVCLVRCYIVADILITLEKISLAVTPVNTRVDFIPWESRPSTLIDRVWIARVGLVRRYVVADVLVALEKISLAIAPVYRRCDAFIPWEAGPVALIYRFRIARVSLVRFYIIADILITFKEISLAESGSGKTGQVHK